MKVINLLTINGLGWFGCIKFQCCCLRDRNVVVITPLLMQNKNHRFIKLRFRFQQNTVWPVENMSQKLKKIMVAKVITARLNDTVQNLAMLMNRHQIGCIVIVDDNDKPVGIVTERDMIKRVICKAVHVEDAKIADVMSKPLATASPDTRAGDAAKMMLEHNIKKMPIVNNGYLVGLVSLTDLVRTEGVIEALNGIALSGIPERLKKTLGNYFSDGTKQSTRRCPLTFQSGASVGCQLSKCMWWTGEECAVNRISGQMEPTQNCEKGVTVAVETQ